MYKNASRHKSKYDLQQDIENLKKAWFQATADVRGKTGELLAQSYQSAYQSVLDKSLDTKDNVQVYIQKKPFKSIGIAVVSGLVIGFLMRK